MDLKNVLKQEKGLTHPDIRKWMENQNFFDLEPIHVIPGMISDYFKYHPQKINDKYKHAVINCRAAQKGVGGMSIADILSGLKEKRDVLSHKNTVDESALDQEANQIGRFLGIKYPKENCDVLVQKYIQKE